MSIDEFFAHTKLKKLLNLPESFRSKIFGTNKLTTDEKFILANLYYLDSVGNLLEFKTLLPPLTGYSQQKCELILTELNKKNFIYMRKNQVSLRIKPLTYE
ncbi:hypothetical protein KFV02_05980 [Desulfohalobiaceae bacterium Ax17]|uniref:hypothetical protein n=1 Tax=Desulfovulcanus ferrireducens TaxID=2831190 RepID=UPI00207BBC8A|nr:hypothetical protein [Desulfovulcanus ferrireducens]MBT8763478.1 hypothetical protein [Desulfovulcanus ferrireducens]